MSNSANLQIASHVNSRVSDTDALKRVFENANAHIDSDKKLISLKATKLRKRTSSFMKYHNPRNRSRPVKYSPMAIAKRLRKNPMRNRRLRRIDKFKYTNLCKEEQNSFSSLPIKERLLESHIWHSKRMKMLPMFGYILPTKSMKHSHIHTKKIAQKNAIIYDQSYYDVIEIKGSRKEIIDMLANHMDVSFFILFPCVHAWSC